MKNIILLASSFFSLVSFADRGGVLPNMYECRGPEAKVGYTTTSFVGKPTFHVEIKDEDVKLPAFPEINVERTRIGNLVSVTDNHMVPVDGPTVRYTLVVPTIQLKDGSSSEEFKTVLVRTSVGNPFMRPTPFTGFVEHNEFHDVTCTAQRVFF